VTWTARDSNRSWYYITSSADGTKLVALDNGGKIYTSASASDKSVVARSGLSTTAAFANGISPGPSAESGQTVSFTVINDNNALFATQPAISSDGTLTFTPGLDPGVATVTVTAVDSGGTADGGVDTSAAQTFTITVTPGKPDITRLSTGSGSSTGGTSVTITGNFFTGATGVTIGGVAATNVVVVNDTTITCTMPAGTVGTASVVVTTPLGSNAANTLYSYTNAAPSIVGACIPSQVLALGAAGTNLDVLSYFTDLDLLDALSFSVQGTGHTSTVGATILGSALRLEGLALGTTTVTVRCTDNASPPAYVEHTFNVTVGTRYPTLTGVGTTKMNRSTGLLEHRVHVTNTMGRAIDGVRITVTNQTSNIRLWNKTHPTLPIVEHRVPMAKDEVKEFVLQFYSTVRSFGSYRPLYSLEEYNPTEDPFVTSTGANALSVKAQTDGGVLVVFASKVGKSYLIEYSDTAGVTWRLSPVAIKAGGTRVQWVDRGPPFTMTVPAIPVTRKYRVRVP
jgi:hypothetical protein